jgi:non-specific serine/threonine protein kinase
MTQRALGEVALYRSDAPRARAAFSQDLALTRALRETVGEAIALRNLGDVALLEHDYGRAKAFYQEALALTRTSGLSQVRLIGSIFDRLAQMAAAQRQPARATRLWSASEALRRASGASWTPVERPVVEQALAVVRKALGETAFVAAWTAGQTLSVDQAKAEALADDKLATPRAARSRRLSEPAPLSAREREVATHIARGLTNRQIGVELVISERTVDRHVANILDKLGLTARTQVAAWVAEQRALAERLHSAT